MKTPSKCYLFLNAPSSQSLFDAEFFGYFMMLEAVFGSLAVPSSLYLTLNRQIHSLVFACIFLSTCNMASNLRRLAAQGRSTDLAEGVIHSIDPIFLNNPTDEYREFLAETTEKQQAATKVKVIKACLDMVDFLQNGQHDAFKSLGRIVASTIKLKSKTQMSMVELSPQNEVSKSNMFFSAVDFSVLKEEGAEQIELLEEFDIRYNLKQNRKEKVQAFVKGSSPEMISEYNKSLFGKVMDGLGITKLINKSDSAKFDASPTIKGAQPTSKKEQIFKPKNDKNWENDKLSKPTPDSDRLLLDDKTPKFSHSGHYQPEDVPPDEFPTIPKPSTDSNRPNERDTYLNKFRQA